MQKVLILDDDPKRHIEFDRILKGLSVCHVWTANQAIQALCDNPPFDLICLDHDLGDFRNSQDTADPGDGTEVAAFINLHLDRKHYPKQIMIHSWNTAGAAHMANLIRETGIPTCVKAFHV